MVCVDNTASGTPIVGYHETGNASQRWIITRINNKTAYVWVLDLIDLPQTLAFLMTSSTYSLRNEATGSEYRYS